MANRLTLKQERFVDEYMLDGNGTRAAIAAGYSKDTAHVIANETLKSPTVVREIADRKLALRAQVKLTPEDILREAMRIAFSDIRNVADFSDDRGVRFFDANELSDDAAATIAEVTSKTRYEPGKKDDPGTIVEDRKIKLWPKLEALKLCAQLIDAMPKKDGPTVDARSVTVNVDSLKALRDELRQLTGG